MESSYSFPVSWTYSPRILYMWKQLVDLILCAGKRKITTGLNKLYRENFCLSRAVLLPVRHLKRGSGECCVLSIPPEIEYRHRTFSAFVHRLGFSECNQIYCPLTVFRSGNMVGGLFLSSKRRGRLEEIYFLWYFCQETKLFLLLDVTLKLREM